MPVFEIRCMKCGTVGQFTAVHPLKAEGLWGEQHALVCQALQQRMIELLNEVNAKIRAEFIHLRKVG